MVSRRQILAGIAGCLAARHAPAIIGARSLAFTIVRQTPMPYDERLEYVESNGNQYVDTGVGVTETTRVEFDQAYLSDGAEGTYKNGTNNWFFMGVRNGMIYGYITRGPATFSVANDLNRHKYVMDSGSLAFYRDNSILGYGTERITTSNSILLFACLNGSVPGYFCSIRKWATKISDGVVVASFIPVLKDGVPCMYDEINGGFYYNKAPGRQLGYKKKDGTIVDPI